MHRLASLVLVLVALAGCDATAPALDSGSPDGGVLRAPVTPTTASAGIVVSLTAPDTTVAFSTPPPDLTTYYAVGEGSYSTPTGETISCGPTVLHSLSVSASDGPYVVSLDIPGTELREGTFEVKKRHGALYPEGCINRDDVVVSGLRDERTPQFFYGLEQGTLTLARDAAGDFVGTLTGTFVYKQVRVTYTSYTLPGLPRFDGVVELRIPADTPVVDAGGPPLD